jgi:hypothetical protein
MYQPKTVNATIPGHAPGYTSTDRSQGETDGVGSTYSAILTERPNLAQTRNLGPDRAESASIPSMPILTSAVRETRRIG